MIETQLPIPFIVGVGRSGTTLLRLMLDANPALSIPPETQFLPSLIQQQPQSIEAFMALLQASHTWHDFDLNPAELEQALAQSLPIQFSLSVAINTFYTLYAQQNGKIRYGDKSPPYVQYMTQIQALMPAVKFIHLIRDGRDVALSYQDKWFGPGANVADAAIFWRDRIAIARKDALNLLPNSYLEVHYEHLVQQPEETLKVVCDFIQLDYHSAMLNYHKTSSIKLAKLKDNALASAEQRQAIHKHTQGPPDIKQIGKWRQVFDAKQIDIFMMHAGMLIKELGYES